MDWNEGKIGFLNSLVILATVEILYRNSLSYTLSNKRRTKRFKFPCWSENQARLPVPDRWVREVTKRRSRLTRELRLLGVAENPRQLWSNYFCWPFNKLIRFRFLFRVILHTTGTHYMHSQLLFGWMIRETVAFSMGEWLNF